MVNFLRWTLNTLDTNWDIGNYATKPTLYDEEDSHVLGMASDNRTKRTNLSDNNTVRAGSQPTTQNEAIGPEYSLRVRAAVSVKIDGVHGDRGGRVADGDEFRTLVNEVKRCLWVERKWPIPDEGVYLLLIEEEDNQSTRQLNDYRIDLTVRFIAHTDLP